MGTKKGRIYGKGAPFKGAPQSFGGEVASNCLPGSATARAYVCQNISGWYRACIQNFFI